MLDKIDFDCDDIEDIDDECDIVKKKCEKIEEKYGVVAICADSIQKKAYLLRVMALALIKSTNINNDIWCLKTNYDSHATL